MHFFKLTETIIFISILYPWLVGRLTFMKLWFQEGWGPLGQRVDGGMNLPCLMKLTYIDWFCFTDFSQ